MKEITLEDQMLGQQEVKNFNDVKSALAWLGTGTGSSFYTGMVDGDGTTGAIFPSGWSVSHTVTGVYTVTHNLGTNYAVVPAPIHTGSLRPSQTIVYSLGSTSFEIRTIQESSGTPGSWPATDMAFHFIVIPQ